MTPVPLSKTYNLVKENRRNESIETSIVIPFYKSEKTIERAVYSALAQDTRFPYDIIIVDDGNLTPVTDSLDWLVHDSRISVYRQPNQGVSMALNLGFFNSRARQIIRLDADDELTPDAVEVFTSFFSANSNVTHAYSDGYWMGPLPAKKWNWMVNNKVTDDLLVTPWVKADFSYEHLQAEMYLGHAQCFTRDVFMAVGGYDPLRRFGDDDWDFALRVARAGTTAHIPQKLHKYHLLESGLTKSFEEERERNPLETR